MIATTRKEFIKYFRSEVLPGIRQHERKYMLSGRVDISLRYQTWNDLIDSLVTDKQLPEKALDWSYGL